MDNNKEDIISYAVKKSEEAGIDPRVIVGLMKQESNFNPNAVGDGGKSVGILQFWPETANEVGIEDRKDPYQSIDGAIRFLAKKGATESTEKLAKALDAFRGNKSGPPILPSVIKDGESVLEGERGKGEKGKRREDEAFFNVVDRMITTIRRHEEALPYAEEEEPPSEVGKAMGEIEKAESTGRFLNTIKRISEAEADFNWLIIRDTLGIPLDFYNLMASVINAGGSIADALGKKIVTDPIDLQTQPIAPLTYANVDDMFSKLGYNKEARKNMGILQRATAYAIENAIQGFGTVGAMSAMAKEMMAAGKVVPPSLVGALIIQKNPARMATSIIGTSAAQSILDSHAADNWMRRSAESIAKAVSGDGKAPSENLANAIHAAFYIGATMLGGAMSDYIASFVRTKGDVAEKAIEAFNIGIPGEKADIPEISKTPLAYPYQRKTVQAVSDVSTNVKQKMPSTEALVTAERGHLTSQIPGYEKIPLEEKLASGEDFRKFIQASGEEVQEAAENIIRRIGEEYVEKIRNILFSGGSEEDIIKSIHATIRGAYGRMKKIEAEAWNKLSKEIPVALSNTTQTLENIQDARKIVNAFIPDRFKKPILDAIEQAKKGKSIVATMNAVDIKDLRSEILKSIRSDRLTGLDTGGFYRQKIAEALTEDLMAHPDVSTEFNTARAITSYIHNTFDIRSSKGPNPLQKALRLSLGDKPMSAGESIVKYVKGDEPGIRDMLVNIYNQVDILEGKVDPSTIQKIKNITSDQKEAIRLGVGYAMDVNVSRMVIDDTGRIDKNFGEKINFFLKEKKDLIDAIDPTLSSKYQKVGALYDEYIDKVAAIEKAKGEKVGILKRIYDESTSGSVYGTLVDITTGKGGDYQTKKAIFSGLVRKYDLDPKKVIADDLANRPNISQVLDNPNYYDLIKSHFSKEEVERIQNIAKAVDDLNAKVGPIGIKSAKEIPGSGLSLLADYIVINVGGLFGRLTGVSLHASYRARTAAALFQYKLISAPVAEYMYEVATNKDLYEVTMAIARNDFTDINALRTRLLRLLPTLENEHKDFVRRVKEKEMEKRRNFPPSPSSPPISLPPRVMTGPI